MKILFMILPILLISSCSSKSRKKTHPLAPVCYRSYDQGLDKTLDQVVISNELKRCKQLASFECEAPEGLKEFHVNQMKRFVLYKGGNTLSFEEELAAAQGEKKHFSFIHGSVYKCR